MTIETPKQSYIPALKTLWQEAFGDSDAFLDMFEKTAFHSDRCRCVTENGDVVAALYWFNCSYHSKQIAYLYAIATLKSHRGQGLCRALMEDTHRHLKKLGYHGALLVPGSPKLFDFYKKIGYQTCSYLSEIRCKASADTVAIRQIGAKEYAILRRALLPKNGVVQENENLDFLKQQADFYAGDGFLLTARSEADVLYGLELLGNKDIAPAIVHSLNASQGLFRVPGNGIPFAMFYPLDDTDTIPPSYFGLAFD